MFPKAPMFQSFPSSQQNYDNSAQATGRPWTYQVVCLPKADGGKSSSNRDIIPRSFPGSPQSASGERYTCIPAQDLVMPDKVYGKIEHYANRILTA